jgi:hypothetical protein
MMTHAHRLTHWADDGPTSLDNLILLCHHHRLVHAGPWHIRGTGANTYAFEPPSGTSRCLAQTDRDRADAEPDDPGRAPPDG